ncbi:24566_t:CDS:1, partial [Gigaspora margarita]
TKEAFFRLFHAGHNPTSAYNTYMEEIQLKFENDEAILADRAICPHKHNVYYLHQKYLDTSIGARNRKEMFSRLAEEVEEFNSNRKGNALMQPYIASTNTDPGQPFVLVIVTNLMKRCHALQQAGELVYMDTTAGLDVLNTPMTILSTSTPIGGLPLAIMLTSNETSNTFTKALDMLKCIMPISAFNGRRPEIGPKVFMTDDCKAERTALHNIWNGTTLLLCVFHFLQAAWKWLWDSKHGINKDDRVALIEYLKKIVFARTETRLEEVHNMFISSQVYLKYPRFQKHFEIMWERRKEWAIAYCQHLTIRDNHTNNFSEAGIRVIKDAIFGRIQAYNIVQIFYFIINSMDLYYTRKLLAVAHNKLDNFIAHRFQLSGWQIGSLNDIQVISHESMIYKHRSSTNPDTWYLVDMRLGICECDPTGAPCKHQSSIAIHYRICGLNQLPTMSIVGRH